MVSTQGCNDLTFALLDVTVGKKSVENHSYLQYTLTVTHLINIKSIDKVITIIKIAYIPLPSNREQIKKKTARNIWSYLMKAWLIDDGACQQHRKESLFPMNQLTVCVSEKYAHFLGKLSCQTEAFTVALPLSGYFIFTENTDSIVFVMMKPSGKHTPTQRLFFYVHQDLSHITFFG